MDNGQNKKNGMMFNNINSWSIDGSNGLPPENVRRKERKCPCFGHDYALRENKATDRGKACSARRLLLIIAAATLLVGIAVAIAVVVTVVLKENPAPEPKPVGGEAKLQISLNKTFIDELQQKDSPEFKDLESKFCASMENIYKSDQSEVKSMPLTCRVDSFSSGSIIVTFLIRVTGDVTGITAGTFSRTIFNKFGTETGVEGDLAFILDTVVVVNYSHIMTTTTTTTTTTFGTTTTTTQTTNPNVTTSLTTIHNTSDTTITFTTAVTDVASTTEKTIPTLSTTSITSTTSSPPVITIKDVKAILFEPVSMACTVQNLPGNWSTLVVSSDVRGVIAAFDATGKVLEHFPNVFMASGSTADDSASVNITMDNQESHCSEKGEFTCTLITAHGNYSDTAALIITAYPTSTISTQTQYNEGVESSISCVGEVPVGTGSLSLYTKAPGGSEFTEYDAVTPTITEGTVTSNCTVTQNVQYTFTPSIQFNGTEAKCEVRNSALPESSVSSSVEEIIVIKADIAFNTYDRREEVGSSDVVIGCNVRNAPSWTTMMVTRTNTESKEITIIFSLDRNNTPSTPLDPRGSYSYTEDDSSVSVTITLSILKCEDSGEYTCTSIGQPSPLATNMNFEIFRKPGIPVLTLNPDQIQDLMFHRGGFEHMCEAEVGYPAGNLSVVYKMKGESTFAPFQSNRIIQYETNINKTSCGTTIYFKFGLNFTSADEEGEVKCVVTNQALGVTTESLVGTLELIPRHYCNTTSAPAFLHHPTNCNKYVQCDQKYPYGVQCPNPTDCADIGSVVTCGSCDGVICPWNITTTTHGPTTTTTPPPSSQFINCIDEKIFMGKSANLTCNITVTFDYINITKATRTLADVTSTGDVIDRNLKTGEYVMFDKSYLRISYDSVECEDEGLFIIHIQKTGGNTESQGVELKILAKPQSISMILHPDFVIKTDRAGSEHVCEGFVGYPGGHLEVTMTKPGDAYVYSVPLADYDGSRTEIPIKTENCNNKARVEFGLKLGTEWQNGTITCTAKNNYVLEDGDVEQNDTVILKIIPADFCTGEDDSTFKRNPYSCNKYVQCGSELPFGKSCGELCYTGLSVAPLCGDCQTYPCTIVPTTTTTTTQAQTTPPPEVFVTCSGVNGLIGSSATVECHVNNSTYSYINVTFTPSETQTSNHFVDIDRISGVVNDDSGADRTVTVSNGGKYISIDFTSLFCSDSGTFHLSVFAVSGDSSTTASVSVRDPPTTNPTLTPATRIATGHLLFPAIKCSGEVGYPSGALNLQIKKDGSRSFVNVTEFTKSEKSTDGDCAVTMEASYTGTPTTSVNGSYIRCATFHQDAVGPLYSPEELVLVIDGTLCNGKEDYTFLYHPYDCGKYIQCASDITYVNACGPHAPCVRVDETAGTAICDTTCTHCPSYHTIIPNSGN